MQRLSNLRRPLFHSPSIAHHLRVATTARHTRTIRMASTEASARIFFSYPNFAVVGASSNPDKYGNIIFNWYHTHDLPVTPINPTTPSITVPSAPGQSFPATASISALPSPAETSLSIVTPPKVTLATLREARKLGFPAVWLQPGSFDDEVLKFARDDEGVGGFKAVVAGEGGRGHEGWCVLVDGEKALKAVGKL